MTRLADEAFEAIYSNIENGLLLGTSSTNQATVPRGRRLIIEYVSGYIFQPPSSALNSVTTMAVQQIVAVAAPLGIAVHDHIIVGKEGHASLKGLKLM
jgi:RadC-like JAB domain